jgi:hypothetical protein
MGDRLSGSLRFGHSTVVVPSLATDFDAKTKDIFENPGRSPNSERSGRGTELWPGKQSDKNINMLKLDKCALRIQFVP